ncbi:MAG: MgtC/SapB family protein, partial [Sphingomonadaceae bacterium]
MTVSDLAYRDLGVALAVGLLVGIERGWRQRDVGAGGRVAGVRTFALLGGLGGIVGPLAQQYGIVIPAILLGAAAIMLIIGYARSMSGPDDVSVTSLVAALLTLCLGILATSGQPALAMAAAAVVTMILALRSSLHGLIQKLGEADVIALARFAIIAGAIWPFLPDERYGPYDAWNPHQLWLVVVFVTGLSFAGYVASRVFGSDKGILATAAIGGAYSSTAVTALLSHRLRSDDVGHGTLSAGIALATSIMFVRVLLLTAIIADFAFFARLPTGRFGCIGRSDRRAGPALGSYTGCRPGPRAAGKSDSDHPCLRLSGAGGEPGGGRALVGGLFGGGGRCG